MASPSCPCGPCAAKERPQLQSTSSKVRVGHAAASIGIALQVAEADMPATAELVDDEARHLLFLSCFLVLCRSFRCYI